MRLAGVIHDRTFDFACDNAVPRSLDYPGVAAFVDLDADGVCGAADAVFEIGFYGWTRDVIARIGDAGADSTDAQMGASPERRVCANFNAPS